MQAVRLHAIGDLRLETVDQPVPVGDEVLIRVDACGICGTDRHLFHGEFPSTPPVTLGHEFSGRIIATGPDVAMPVGALVTCDPNDPCMLCPPCRRGQTNLCINPRVSGITRDGGFAPYAVFPARKASLLPDGLHPHFGAFCEPLACTIHGMDRLALRPGERVVIIGGGVIGLLALQLARLAGAEVMMLTRSREKRDLAVQLGARHAADSPDAALRIWPEGADAVIECAGVAETVAACPGLTMRGGRILILGVVAKGTRVEIEPFDLLFREISLIPSFINPFTQGRAAQLIASGAVDVAPLISRTLPLSEAVAAITQPARPGEVRALVIPD